MLARRLPVAVLLAVLLAGCGGGAPTPAVPFPTASPSPVPRAPVLPRKVLIVVLENHSRDQAWQRMPFLRDLALRHGYTTDYRGLTHPSLPNYLAIAGGSTFGVHDDRGPSHHPLAGPSVFGQALAAGRTAKVYAEGMPRTCAAASRSRYAVKHNPWPYFHDDAEQVGCGRFAVPAGTAASGAFRSDAASDALPTVGLLVPDTCHDGHDCGLSVADDWLRQWLPVVLTGTDFRTGQLAVVVTFDEDDRSAGNRVLTVVVAQQLHGAVVPAPLSHLSLSRWLSQLSGSPGLRDASEATSLGTAFGLAD